MRSSAMKVLVPGVIVAFVGAVIASDVWRIGGIVILMIGAALILLARCLSIGR